MGVLTLAQMKTEVRAAFGDSTQYDARLDNLFTLAQDRLVSKHDFEELKVRATLATTSVTADPSVDMVVALPVTLRQLYSVILVDDMNSRRLQPIPGHLWDKEIPYAEAFTRARPTKYRRWGTNIELWRVPDAAYVLRGHYTTWGTAFTTDSQKSDLERKDQLLILLVQIWLAVLLDRPDRANYFWAVFKTMYEESFHVSIYQADVNMGSTSSSASVDNYWQNPFVSGLSQVE